MQHSPHLKSTHQLHSLRISKKQQQKQAQVGACQTNHKSRKSFIYHLAISEWLAF